MARPQVHGALHILEGKINTCNRFYRRYMLSFIFWVGKHVPVAGTHCALYFEWENKYRWQVQDICGWVIRYLQLARPQVHAQFHILGRITGTCNRPGLRYMSGFIFWVGKQVSAINQVVGTSLASYFRRKNMYLQPARPQIHAWLYILGRKTSTYDRPGLRYIYILGFIFLVKKKGHVTG